MNTPYMFMTSVRYNVLGTEHYRNGC